jgi:hypothetical protein
MVVCEVLRLRGFKNGAVPQLVERIEGGPEDNLGGFDGGYVLRGHGEVRYHGSDDLESLRREFGVEVGRGIMLGGQGERGSVANWCGGK